MMTRDKRSKDDGERECHHLVQTWCLPPPSNPVSIGVGDLRTSDLSIAFMWSKMCILRETRSNYQTCVLISLCSTASLQRPGEMVPSESYIILLYDE